LASGVEIVGGGVVDDTVQTAGRLHTMRLNRVTRSTVIDAPIDRVWEVLRDFNSHVDWHPVVAESFIEDGLPADQVGCVRNFRLADGNALREQLIALSDRDYLSTYCILDTTIPLINYVATVRLKPVTDGSRTFWHWESTFATPPGRDRELTENVGRNVYEAGFEALRRHLAEAKDQVESVHGLTRAAGSHTRHAGLPGTAIVLTARGDAENLRAVATEAPPPGAGEVRLRQTAIGVNYIDIYTRTGQYANLLEVGGVPGFEAAGTVIDVGTGVSHLLPGDRVAYTSLPAGAYASVRTLAAGEVVRLPDHVSEEQGAAVMLKGMTAEVCLFRLHHVVSGETVLVHAAAGALGMLVAQWAQALGASVIGVVGSEDKARVARESCQHVVIARDGHFADGVLDATAGRGADLIIDGIGEAACEENMRSIFTTGHWISVGAAGGAWRAIDPAWLSSKSVNLSRPVIFHYLMGAQNAARLREMSGRVFDALKAGVLRPRTSRYALAAASDAHRDLESRRTTGQLVLMN
jgi:NADPH:quinone reductase-like Zn-dependent oxidoreductase